MTYVGWLWHINNLWLLFQGQRGLPGEQGQRGLPGPLVRKTLSDLRVTGGPMATEVLHFHRVHLQVPATDLRV